MTAPQEEQAESRLSLQPLRRLYAASAAHHHSLFWASVLALLLAGMDISLPLLLRRAVDRHLTASWAVVQADKLDVREAAEAAGGRPVGAAKVLVQLPRLNELMRQRLLAADKVEKERYFAPLAESTLQQIPAPQRRELLAAREGEPALWVVTEKDRNGLSLSQRIALHQADFPALRKLALIYGLLLVLSFLGTWLLTVWLSVIAQKVLAALRLQLYEHLLRLPVVFFDKTAVGRLLTRVTSDIEMLAEIFTQSIVFLLKDSVLVLGAIGMMLALSWRLTLVIFFVLPILVAATLLFRVLVRTAYRRQRAAVARLNGFIQESITGMRIIQAFRAEGFFKDKLAVHNQENYSAGLRLMTVFAVFRPFIELTRGAVIMLLLWSAAPGIFTGTVSLGLFVALLAYLDKLYEPIMDLTEKYNILQSGAAAAERVFGLLDEYEEDVGGPSKGVIRGEIEFRNVWFAYKKDEWVLRDVSFKIPAGQTAAIVGHTGSGKTTLLALLLRFYDPQRGQILVDGIEVKRWRKSTLRRSMALVLQDVALIEGTVAENIAFLAAAPASPATAKDNDSLRLNLDTEPAQPESRADNPALQALLTRLSAGLDTKIGEGGRGLSQGEKQLVAAARALAQNPPVLLMDEATASVDSATEAELQTALNALAGGRTAIIIAHRLSTIEHAGQILVMRSGQLIESGTHAGLMQADGLYRRLHDLQFRSLSGASAGREEAGA